MASEGERNRILDADVTGISVSCKVLVEHANLLRGELTRNPYGELALTLRKSVAEFAASVELHTQALLRHAEKDEDPNG